MGMRQLKISQSITVRDGIVEKYLSDIGPLPMVTPEDEVVLAQRIKAGDQAARDKLVKANLRFVVSVAKQYQNQGLSLPDLINEGNLGMIIAAQRFDETRGNKFISYAVWWIRQNILQALAEHSRIVRLPANKVGVYNKANQAYSAFEQENEREPSHDELAEIIGIDTSEVAMLFENGMRHLSLDAPIHEDEELTLLDRFESKDEKAPDERLNTESLRSELLEVLSSLSPREALIIKAHFGLDDTSMEDIMLKYDIKENWISVIKEKAMDKLKQSSRNKTLRKFLG